MLSLLAALPWICLQASSVRPTPPDQPAQGPGGAVYPHASVRKSLHGEGALAYWLFEPAEPRPDTAPVVVFVHGFGATNPRTYGAWIEHIVRRGAIVVYPRFQRGIIPRPATFTPNAAIAVRDALDQLSSAQHVRPDLERAAFLGHSVGGLIAANLAALARDEGLPAPRALFAVQPGSAELGVGAVELADLATIPADTLVLTLAGDSDTISGEADARRIHRGASAVPPGNKNCLLMQSDAHGTPALRANHLLSLATDDRYGDEVAYREVPSNREADALDYYGTWKLFDGLCDAAFEGRNREYALGDTPQQRFMGNWSDGRPVRPLQVLDL